MAGNTYIQNIFYHYILEDAILAEKFQPSFFTAKPVQTAFALAKDYLLRYAQAPTADQLKELVKKECKSEELPDDVIDVIYSQKKQLAAYTDEWLYDETTNWAIIENVKKTIGDVVAYLKLHQENMDKGEAKDVVEHIKMMFNRGCVLDFSDTNDGGSDFWNAASHKRQKLVTSPTGYDFIDFCFNGGYFPGSLTCFVGAPKIGKSLWLQNLCAASVKRGENNAYITLELPEEMVTSRIGSNMFSIPSLEYSKYTDDPDRFADVLQKYRNDCIIPPGALVVKQFPTSTLTVLELEAYLLKEEERLSTDKVKFKFKNVFLDYINIMRNYRNPNSENTYMKIKQLAEDIKAMATKNNWSVITATQTNRAQLDTNDIATNQVAESNALGATVDMMFGIIADPLMKAQGKYYLKCMLDRVSPQENKKKLYTCDFNYLRLTEDSSEGIIDVTQENVNAIKTNPPARNGVYHQGQSQQPQQQSTIPAGIPQKPSGDVALISDDIPGRPIAEQNRDLIRQIGPLVKVSGASLFGSDGQYGGLPQIKSFEK